MPKPLALTRQDTPMPKDSFGKDELRDSHSDVKMLPNPRMMFKVGGNATHLITPSEIISGALSTAESNQVSKSDGAKNQDGSVSSPRIAEVEAKHVDESKSGQDLELEAIKEAESACESSEKAQNLFEQTVEMVSERSVTTDKYSVEESRPPSDRRVPDHTGAAGENVSNKSVEMPGRSDYSPVSREQSSSKEKVLHLQASGQSSPSTSAFNSTESSHEPASNAYPPIDSSSEVADMQSMLQQVIIPLNYSVICAFWSNFSGMEILVI
jgi:enhancer of mRNA-decapping protein 4